MHLPADQRRQRDHRAGYDLAVARAQHALMELAERLSHRGVNVKYAIQKEIEDTGKGID